MIYWIMMLLLGSIRKSVKLMRPKTPNWREAKAFSKYLWIIVLPRFYVDEAPQNVVWRLELVASVGQRTNNVARTQYLVLFAAALALKTSLRKSQQPFHTNSHESRTNQQK